MMGNKNKDDKSEIKNDKDMKTRIMNLFRMMGKSLMQIFAESAESAKSAKPIFATYATYASANFVGEESCKSTVRYALWSRSGLTKPLFNPYSLPT